MDFRRKFEFGLAWRTIAPHRRDPADRQGGGTRRESAPAWSSPRSSGSLRSASLWNFIRRTNFLVSRFIESVRFEDYSQRFSDPSGGGFDVLGQTLDQALKTLQARHTQESAEARYLAAIVDDSPSALLTSIRDGRVEMLNKAARQLFARHAAAPARGPRSARARARRCRPAAAGHAQDHPADPRRRSAESDLRFGPGRAARPAGHRSLDPAGAERARRAGSRRPGRPRARAHPRDHEFADPGDVARTHRRRAGRGGGQARQRLRRRQDRDRNRRPPGRRNPPLRRKLSRVRADARHPPPPVQGEAVGRGNHAARARQRRRSARSTRGSRSSRRP